MCHQKVMRQDQIVASTIKEYNTMSVVETGEPLINQQAMVESLFTSERKKRKTIMQQMSKRDDQFKDNNIQDGVSQSSCPTSSVFNSREMELNEPLLND